MKKYVVALTIGLSLAGAAIAVAATNDGSGAWVQSNYSNCMHSISRVAYTLYSSNFAKLSALSPEVGNDIRVMIADLNALMPTCGTPPKGATAISPMDAPHTSYTFAGELAMCNKTLKDASKQIMDLRLDVMALGNPKITADYQKLLNDSRNFHCPAT
ncbi:MAG: hypothetical protein V4490_03450 [Pseudomonadota bacterium]